MDKEFEKYTLETIGNWSKIDSPGETTKFYLLVNDFESLKLIAEASRKFHLQELGKNADPEVIRLTNEIFDDYLQKLNIKETEYYSKQPGAYN